MVDVVVLIGSIGYVAVFGRMEWWIVGVVIHLMELVGCNCFVGMCLNKWTNCCWGFEHSVEKQSFG